MFHVHHPDSDQEMERELDYESVILLASCFAAELFLTVMFKYLACYVLWIYFQWQWSPHRPNTLLQIFLTKALHQLLNLLLLHHRHIVLLIITINKPIILLRMATDSFQIPKYPRPQDHLGLLLMNPPVIILAIFFHHIHLRMLCTDSATTQSQKAPSKLKLW